jgi:protein phosphatase
MAEKRPEEMLAAAIEQANAEILQYAQRTNSGLGTTVTAALVIGEAAAVANVGDSRTYHLRDGQLQQVTEDHSFVARLVAEGLSTPEEARVNPRRHEIYRCVGDKPGLLVDTFVVDLHVGDRLILCSDGLWEVVSNQEIQRIVEAAPTPQVAADELIASAVRAGGDDNISVVVVEVE